MPNWFLAILKRGFVANLHFDTTYPAGGAWKCMLAKSEFAVEFFFTPEALLYGIDRWEESLTRMADSIDAQYASLQSRLKGEYQNVAT